MTVPIALTIAGSDSGGGAGIQADLKTFSALGVYGASVITAVTAQNTCRVSMVESLTPAMAGAQLEAVLGDLRVDAVKLGMLASSELIARISAGLAECRAPIVLDPVMVAKSGDLLLQEAAIHALITQLLPRCSLLTPNLPEAARLLDRAPARNEAEMLEQGRALLALGPAAVLMKGGHLEGPRCIDLLVEDGRVTRMEAARVPTANTHGTGCSLSSAIAALLARGLPLPQAVQSAHAWLQAAIHAADSLGIGQGRGPVHHFHALWSHV